MSFDAALTAVVEKAIAPLVQRIADLEAAIRAGNQPDADELLTVEEIAEILGVTNAAVYRRIARGNLPVVRVGRTIRIRRKDIAGVAEE